MFRGLFLEKNFRFYGHRFIHIELIVCNGGFGVNINVSGP